MTTNGVICSGKGRQLCDQTVLVAGAIADSPWAALDKLPSVSSGPHIVITQLRKGAGLQEGADFFVNIRKQEQACYFIFLNHEQRVMTACGK